MNIPLPLTIVALIALMLFIGCLREDK
jgi:hypothetical protein